MRNAWRELVKAAVPKIAYKQWAEYVRAIARARDRVT
jgi:N-dimethylarginine dimethylaminohydrolase